MGLMSLSEPGKVCRGKKRPSFQLRGKAVREVGLGTLASTLNN